MAAAEARAVWQRAANRCFVQEDAKRAPKLPPSSSSLSSSPSPPHSDTNANYDTNFSQLHSHPNNDLLSPNLMPLNWNLCPADTRWWLQLHPNFAYQREFLIYEPKSNVLPRPCACPRPAATYPTSPSPVFDEAQPPKAPLFMSFMKHGGCTEKLRYDAKPCEDPLMAKRSEPWWRVADGEQLASMVAQKAAQHVENCDLPRPSPTQTLCYSCGDHMLPADPTVKVGMEAFGDVNLAYYDTERSTRPERERDVKKGSREELLEALCHSQTRAREAETAAKKAHSEKEDIVQLLFRQASHLFACKQWLKMLQLENLCLQLRIRDHHFPFPFSSNSNSNSNSKPPPSKIHKGNSIRRYVIVFAVGLGLAGAGLLFGWTLGWLLPNL